MSLGALRLEHLRALESAELSLHSRLNLITGGNGAGKTSVLEAAYLLGRGRSFRTRHTEQLIRHEASMLWVHGRVETPPGHGIGVQCDRDGGLIARIDQRPAGSLAELSEVFPVQIIDPGIHRLVEDGPVQRRRWLDWAVFHVEPGFVARWQGYHRALRQRNAALKGGTDPGLWDRDLVRYGELITAARSQLVELLQPYWKATLVDLGAVDADVSFSPGWARDRPLADALAAHRAMDIERSQTGIGPHRFEIVLRVAGRPAREQISRGQQKVLGAAMALAMARCIAGRSGRIPTLLLDDPAAELDRDHTDRLLRAAGALGGQLLVTALRAADCAAGTPDAVFHVEQGGVKRV